MLGVRFFSIRKSAGCRGLVWVMGFLLGLVAVPGWSAEEGGYVMGVFPHLPPRELEKVFSPMASDLSAAVERKIALRSNTTYERFSENLDHEVFDIAFVQPFDYVRVADELGYRPLATRTEKLTAIIVVKQDSAIKGLTDLKGKKIALPPPVSAVSHLVKGYLLEQDLVPGVDVSLSHHRSHVSCMQQVLIGEADACGTASPALRFFQHKMNVTMQVIGESLPIPHTLFAIHPRVPESDRERLRQRILSWGSSERGRALLARGRLKPFVPVEDSAYDVVRDLANKQQP